MSIGALEDKYYWQRELSSMKMMLEGQHVVSSDGHYSYYNYDIGGIGLFCKIKFAAITVCRIKFGC